MSGQEEAPLPPHVLIFPLPIQGHVNSMLNLAELLCLAGLDITFLISDFAHCRLHRYANIQARFGRYAGFRFKTISDGLPDDHPRAGERIMELLPSMKDITGPLFKEMMVSTDCLKSDDRRTVTCVIADGILSLAGDVALEEGIPLVYFRTISACSFWIYFCLQEIIEAGELPLKGNGMDQLVKSVPGMEGFLRRRDLPGFCRTEDADHPAIQCVKTETRQTTRAQAVILNTFEDLESPILSHIRIHMPNLYTVGPLHSQLKTRLSDQKTATPSMASGSFWEEDKSCISWLSAQSPRSVLYVSFGSVAMVTRDELMEFWYGLVNSGQRFLWVVRPNSISDKNGESHVPAELLEGTKERGYMVDWAPQEEVLNHPSVGGFLTHSGWNSTLESIVVGVPMICWPYFADQQVNSRFVNEVWKLGLDMKDTCDRIIVEKMVRDLMEVRKNEILQWTDLIAKLARKAVRKCGSSYNNLDNLIKYIKSMVE
ncbi:7-deoxyloganetic acid glucosyl transferase [Sarracenia purpurea var. burkii]